MNTSWTEPLEENKLRLRGLSTTKCRKPSCNNKMMVLGSRENIWCSVKCCFSEATGARIMMRPVDREDAEHLVTENPGGILDMVTKPIPSMPQDRRFCSLIVAPSGALDSRDAQHPPVERLRPTKQSSPRNNPRGRDQPQGPQSHHMTWQAHPHHVLPLSPLQPPRTYAEIARGYGSHASQPLFDPPLRFLSTTEAFIPFQERGFRPHIPESYYQALGNTGLEMRTRRNPHSRSHDEPFGRVPLGMSGQGGDVFHREPYGN